MRPSVHVKLRFHMEGPMCSNYESWKNSWMPNPQCWRYGRDRIVVSTSRCGRDNPGSNPGHGRGCEVSIMANLPADFWRVMSEKANSQPLSATAVVERRQFRSEHEISPICLPWPTVNVDHIDGLQMCNCVIDDFRWARYFVHGNSIKLHW